MKIEYEVKLYRTASNFNRIRLLSYCNILLTPQWDNWGEWPSLGKQVKRYLFWEE